MRNAEDIVREYLQRGYSVDRIRILASAKPEAVRERILQLLEERVEVGEEPVAAGAPEDVAASADGDDAEETDVLPAESVEREALQEEIERLEDAPPKKRRASAQRKRKRKTANTSKTSATAAGEPDEGTAMVEASAGKADRLAKQVATLEDELDHANATVAEFQGRVRKLEAIEAELEAVSEEKTALAERAEGLQRQVEELSGAHASLEKTQEALVATRKKLARTKKQLDESQDNLNHLAAELEEAEARAAEQTELLAERGTVEGEAAVSEQEVDTLRQQLAENERRLADLQDHLASREDELHGLRSKFEKEADTLREQAEHEVRLMRRHVLFYGRLARTAGVAAGVLFCFLLAALAFGWFARDGRPGIARHTVEIGRGAREAAAGTPGRGFLAGLEEVERETPAPVGSGEPRTETTGESDLPAPIKVRTPEPERPASPAPEPAVQPVPPAPEPAKPQLEYIVYTVRKGDKLWSICNQQLHNTNIRCIQRVAEINKLQDPGMLRPGQKLKLPLSEKRD